MLLIKYYENAKDNAAFARCIDVMAQLMLKYGNKVLEQQEQKAPVALPELPKEEENRILDKAA